jgi:hypothetical protein
MNNIKTRIIIVLTVLFIIVMGGALGFIILEDRTFLDALYFSVVTISTVGYGDIFPVTTGGKILAMALIVIGVGTFLTVTANAVQMLLQRRQEHLRRQRLDMLVSVFFSEIGTRMLQIFSECDPELGQIHDDLTIDEDWAEEDYTRVNTRLAGHAYTIDPIRMDIKLVRDFLGEKGDLLLRLLENPNLLEHESFTDLLRAIFHLKEELVWRPEPLDIPDTDAAHLANDAKRVYVLLAKQWISYMLYLKKNYPYFFSLALRTNPFCEDRSAIVT